MSTLLRSRWLILVAVFALFSAGGAAQGQGEAKAPPTAAADAEDTLISVVDLATREPVGPALDGLISQTEKAAELQKGLEAQVSTAASTPGLSGAMKEKGKALVDESKKVREELAKESSWLKGAKKALQIIDFVSTGSKAAAHLAEGDKTGAVTVIVDDACKKACAAAGAFGMSWLPGIGPIAGSAAGEEFHTAYVRPGLDKREKELRDQEYRERYLNKPWLRKEQLMDAQGNVRELDHDMYFDRESGLVRRRPPAEQAKYEAQKHRDWLDSKKLSALHSDRMNGKIDEAEYQRAMSSYRNRDKSKPWDPREPSAGAILEHVIASRSTTPGTSSTTSPPSSTPTKQPPTPPKPSATAPAPASTPKPSATGSAPKPSATASAPPPKPAAKDMGCLCKCACAAAGFNVNNVKSYYSTAPVKHVNPSGDVSASCMNPGEGPCVCQGFVCRRAALVSTGSCASACGG